MTEITKKDIKEIVIGALNPFAKAVQNDFRRIDKRFDGMDKRLDGVDKRLDGVENRLSRVESDLVEVKQDVRWMKENSGELFSKLDKFIALYEEQRQEIVILGGQLRRLEEELSQVKIKLAKLEDDRRP